MAIFQGTSGNDRLIGTASADTFTPLLGQDTVDGGAGADLLTVDYTAITVNGGTTTITADGTSAFTGLIAAAGTAASVTFSGIETLAVTLSAGSDTVTLNAAPLAAGAALTLNGGAGNDTLIADFSAFAGTSFVQGVNFLITADHGSYAGFEQFDLTLGGGTNTVTLQGGADVVRSTGGADVIDLGGGRDSWIADFSGWSAAISFGFDGDRNVAAVANGTSVTSVEGGAVTGGSADDAFFLNGWNGFTVDGGAGRDQLVWDESGKTGASYAAIFLAAQPDSFQGSIQNSTFTAIEQINVALSDADNYAFVDTAPLAGGATMNLDGGGGRDLLEVDFSAYADTTFTLDASGTALTSHGTYGHFEDFGMALGGGTNTVTTGAGDDTIYSLGGVDTINAGAGFDSWGGDYSEVTAALTFSWNGTAGTATLSNGTTLAGFETGYLVTGAGNDVFTLAGLAPFDVYGGAGVDRLVRNDAGLTGATPNSFLYSAGAAFYGSADNGAFDGIEQLAVTFSDDDNFVYVNAAPLLQGATVDLDGGAGRDTLLADFSAFTGTTFTVATIGATTGAITSDHGHYAGFEAFSIALGGGINSVTTGAANDIVQAGFGGISTIRTGAGDDAIYGGTGAETVVGGTGTDTFWATGKAADFAITRDGIGGYIITDLNLADGDQGIDRLTEVERIQFTDSLTLLPAYGAGGTFTGTIGADTLTGTAFDDTLLGLAGDDVLSGDDGADLLNGGAGNDRIMGGAGIDTLTYADAAAAVRISLSVLNTAQVTGGAGNDTLLDTIENLTGSAFADTLTGNALDNRITGGAGNDTLDGLAGADTLIGGAGNDSYFVDNTADSVIELAGEGTDSVYSTVTYTLGATLEYLVLRGPAAIDGTGNALANSLIGNAAANTLTGLDGNDRLDGGLGADLLVGGTGNDSYVVDNAADVVVEQVNEGTDLVTATIGWTLATNVENLTLGGTGAIDGTGNAAANQITGNAAANRVFGLAGNDTLSGGAGNDLLVGGAGADALSGGAGADTFRFDVLETAADKDTIRDYTHGTDHLELARSAFAGLGTAAAGQLAATALAIGTAATTASQRLVYNPATGALYYDADGLGGAAQVQIAVLTTKPLLDASDFLLI